MPDNIATTLEVLVIRELELRRERLGEDTFYPHPQTRYVTDWIADE